MSTVLVIDDDIDSFEAALRHALKDYTLLLTDSSEKGLATLETHPEIEVVLLDMRMPAHFGDVDDREGLATLTRIHDARPELPVIMLTAVTDVDVVVQAMQIGAFHFQSKPFDRDKLRELVAKAVDSLTLRRRVTILARAQEANVAVQQGTPQKLETYQGIIGAHPLMQALYTKIQRAATFEDLNILILGETGSGKEMVAKALVNSSSRSTRPFVTINCAALPESVLESELFGHTKGAFTGADKARLGKFREANGGTLFLDEIGEMATTTQAKILRAIEYGEITPVGSDRSKKVDVRFLCATNRDLAVAKESGTFRADLYFRIAEIPLSIPPLRYRVEDIPALAHHFLRECREKYNVDCAITPQAIVSLADYGWPGNVRELASVIKILVFEMEGTVINAAQVRAHLNLPARPSDDEIEELPAENPAPTPAPQPDETTPLEPGHYTEFEYPVIEDISEYKRRNGEEALKSLLERAINDGGNTKSAMALLSIPLEKHDSFRKWVQRLGLSARRTE
jgi:DNA-binding NtrC family response regulator